MKNGLIVDRDGTQRWYLDGQLHRDENDLPAIIYQRWCRHGICCQRDNNLPAVILTGGYQEWYRHGQLHRDNGPAIINSDGSQTWYRHGKPINVKKWIGLNQVVASWESWDDVTWSLFRLEFL